jgi:hypothetical protein
MDYKEALERFTETKSYWADIYDAHRVSTRFSIGLDQWSDKEIKARGGINNCLSVPVLPQYIHQVVNDMRMNTPSINVLPGEGGGDKETAKILKGLIRNIEYKSKADSVYDTAGDYAVRGGFGWIGVDHDYINEESFLQELKLRRFQNPQSVYIDMNSVEIDGSDAEIAFVLEEITKDAFEDKYPGKEFISFDGEPKDTTADVINICEVFVKKYETVTKAQDITGKVVDADEDEVRPTRKLKKVKICRYKFSGGDLLEETTFPGKFIPIVPCYGEEVWVDGERKLLSLISLAMDAQRRVNKWATKESDLLDMAPISPVQAPVGAVEDFMEEWGSPGSVNVMRYKMFDEGGNPLNKPERLPPPPIPTGIINAMAGAKESVKEALGMYNASVGNRSNETSGVAINARKVEGEVATYHFADNRNKAIEQVGRILISAIPEIYDTDRVIRIIGDEENAITVGINGAPMQENQDVMHDLRTGQYDVRVTTGASYTTKRQEAAALLGDALKANPALMGVMGDLYFKNLDVAGAEAIAARVRKTIPPQLIADEEQEKGEQPQIDPEKEQLAQQLEQMNAQMQQMGAELQSKQGEEQARILEQQNKQAELQLKAQAEQNKAQLEAAKLDLERQRLELDAQNANKEMPIVNDTQERELAEREMRLKEAEFALKAQQIQLDAIKTAQSEQQEPNEQGEIEQEGAVDVEQKAQTNAQLMAIQQTIEGLIAAVSAPIQVIRDGNGVITGAE